MIKYKFKTVNLDELVECLQEQGITAKICDENKGFHMDGKSYDVPDNFMKALEEAKKKIELRKIG